MPLPFLEGLDLEVLAVACAFFEWTVFLGLEEDSPRLLFLVLELFVGDAYEGGFPCIRFDLRSP